ncbi:MBL fold metallo-hydrolase [Oceanicella sp. SM1341]|uniref:MBL fold metallo-hydrolase n=1 Tax=Oceanicella sp. SM1341 TaxID=1548889 RepID=UPI000E53EB57|nr:MBL fold metallo-hydrolase [Oceanicella sp. SM1341]
MQLPAPGPWFRSEQIAPGVTRLWEPPVHRFFRANSWLIEGRDADLLVDFGTGLAPLAPALARDPAKPLLALATHAHADHVGGFHEFAERLGHAAEAGAFAAMPDSATLADAFRALDTPVEGAAGPLPEYRLRPAPLTRVLEEGDLVELGDRSFEVLHLPGHSPGSIGLMERGGGLFLTGDAIYPGELVDDLPGADIPAYLGTMERLAGLEAGLVLGGHNGPLTGAAMREIARGYLARRG